ncbi:MAG: hypothetical protein LLF76_11875 [Planctomycetaceae bacterium]|nr:hypothetical protein [Planctomycetaceae bacterium]
MKMVRILVLFLAVSLLNGCVQYWYQPGMSIQQAQADHQECFKGILRQTAINAMSQADVQAMNNCMAQKGYSLVFAYQLPKSADRADPVSSPYWKLYGVAGEPRLRDYPLFEY